MKTLATPRPVLRLNHQLNSLSLTPTSSTRRGLQPPSIRSSKGCVVKEMIDYKDVFGIGEIMLTSASGILSNPSNQPHGRILATNPTSGARLQVGWLSTTLRGRDLLRRIAESFLALREKDIEVEFRWVLGHSGVCGNEQADIAAKAAAS
jgi:hypothetical protein